MSALSNIYENSTLDHLMGTATLTSPTTVYVGLFKSTVDAATTLENLEQNIQTDEVSNAGTSYARVAATFSSAASGSTSTNADVTFSTATANWGEVTHIAVMDAATGGSVIVAGALDTAKTIESGDTFEITTSNLTVTLA